MGITRLTSAIARFDFGSDASRDAAFASFPDFLDQQRLGEPEAIAYRHGVCGFLKSHTHPHVRFAEVVAIGMEINHLAFRRAAEEESGFADKFQMPRLHH